MRRLGWAPIVSAIVARALLCVQDLLYRGCHKKPSCRAMCSEEHIMAFLAVIRRLNGSTLGLTVAVDDNILLVHAIKEKSPVAE